MNQEIKFFVVAFLVIFFPSSCVYSTVGFVLKMIPLNVEIGVLEIPDINILFPHSTIMVGSFQEIL